MPLDFDEYFALHARGAFREAYAALREILSNDPYWSKVGDLYVWCADLELQVTSDMCEARRLLDKARELGCRYPASYHRARGFLRWRMGERDEGIRDIEKSIELEPSVRNLMTLGEVLSSDGDERAAGVLRRVLDQDPNNCLVHVYLGILSSKSGDRGRAILLAKRAEKLAASAIDHQEVGRLYQEVQEFRCAIDAFLNAERLGCERKGELYAALAVCYFWLGDNETGRKYLQWAIKRDPKNEYVRYVFENSGDLMKESGIDTDCDEGDRQ
jgi:tetratricopeptide (TPR) repeat protein